MVKNLKLLRDKAGYSQAQLAELAGVGPQSIYQYEKDIAEPDVATLIKMACVFGVSVDYLVGATTVPYPIGDADKYLMTDDETDMISKYRKLSSSGQNAINTLLDEMREG